MILNSLTPNMATVETQIKVGSATGIKTGLSLAFFGISLLAASAVANTVVNIPDLKISKITFNEDVAYRSNTEEDKITIYYKNEGRGASNLPFTISLRIDPDPGQEVELEQLANQMGETLAVSSFNFFPVERIEESVYNVDVSKIYTVSGNLLSGLNEYRLEPGQIGQVQIIIPKFYEGILPEKTLKISALIDNGNSEQETDENNNTFEQIF